MIKALMPLMLTRFYSNMPDPENPSKKQQGQFKTVPDCYQGAYAATQLAAKYPQIAIRNAESMFSYPSFNDSWKSKSCAFRGFTMQS